MRIAAKGDAYVPAVSTLPARSPNAALQYPRPMLLPTPFWHTHCFASDRGLMNNRPIGVDLLRRLTLGIGVTAAAALLLCLTTFAAAPRREKAPNPHWQPDACATCHTLDKGKKLPITPENADELCLKCHDGRKAAMEFHPVGRPLDPEKYARPANWPLVDNRLACLTCHNMKVGCDQNLSASSANRMMLRDYRSGPNASQPFCQNCHKAATYQKLNPHIMLLPDSDQIVEDKCLFCHEKVLDRKAMARTSKPSLKTDQLSLCRDCHQQHKDAMIHSHVGLKLSENMLAYMHVREVTGLKSNIGEQTVAQAKVAGHKPIRMVPGPAGEIACTTCHNPHEQGVFPKDSPLAFRAMRLVDNTRLVSPVHGQTWCRHCHDF